MRNLLMLKLLQGLLTAAILYLVYQGGMWLGDLIQQGLAETYSAR